MKKLVPFLLVIIAFKALSQQVNYKVLVDDPGKTRKFSITLNPATVDMQGLLPVFSMGLGIDAQYNFNDRFIFDFLNYKGYLNGPNDVQKENGNLYKFSVRQAGAAFVFSKNDKYGPQRVTLSSNSWTSGGYEYTESTFITVDGTTRKLLMARGGAASHESSF